MIYSCTICNVVSCIHSFRGIFTFDSSDVLKSMSQDNLAKSGQRGPTYTEMGVTRRHHRELDKR